MGQCTVEVGAADKGAEEQCAGYRDGAARGGWTAMKAMCLWIVLATAAAGSEGAMAMTVQHGDVPAGRVPLEADAEVLFPGAGAQATVPVTFSGGAPFAERETGSFAPQAAGLSSRDLDSGVESVSAGTPTPGGESARERFIHARSDSGLPDWEGLLLLGNALCGGSVFCVYQASRAQWSGALAQVIPMAG
jgi:hypothetical protein